MPTDRRPADTHPYPFVYPFLGPFLLLFVASLRTIAPEQRKKIPLYELLISTAYVLLGAFVVASAAGILVTILPNDFRAAPWLSPVLAVVSGAVFLAFLFSLSALRYSTRAYLETRDSAPSLDVGSVRLDYRSFAQISKEYERVLEADFQRNLGKACSLDSLQWRGLRFFEDGEYHFASRVNVLLGKNGYGKTLLLRTLAALIKSNLEHSEALFPEERAVSPGGDTATPEITLNITRDGETDTTLRDPEFFALTAGPIPLLAIPDSRFVDRVNRVVGLSVTGVVSLAREGARHFLTQEPYQDIIFDLLSQLGIEYVAHKSTFAAPLFRLIEDVFQDLTEDEKFRFHSISRVGQTGFEILVTTTGSEDSPYPIQLASQGTLSVLAMVGLIYSFLRSLQPQSSEDKTLTQSGIVIIDELDAHLHPNWQQKIVWILTRKFPNVQFILSAHSPTIVAGCDWGEVSVLRRGRSADGKNADRFWVDTLKRDFMGATTRDLYKAVFEIDDFDRLYLEYATKLTLDSSEERAREIARLDAKRDPTAQDDARLTQLVRDERLMQRVSEVREERIEELERELELLRSAAGSHSKTPPREEAP